MQSNLNRKTVTKRMPKVTPDEIDRIASALIESAANTSTVPPEMLESSVMFRGFLAQDGIYKPGDVCLARLRGGGCVPVVIKAFRPDSGMYALEDHRYIDRVESLVGRICYAGELSEIGGAE
jgi:hypothetical protein